jgi:hypothetical protein
MFRHPFDTTRILREYQERRKTYKTVGIARQFRIFGKSSELHSEYNCRVIVWSPP